MNIDPTKHYCVCGNTWTPGTIHKMIMLLFGSYSWRCPRCGTVMKFKLMHHVVKTKTEQIKNKESVYKNG